MREQQFGGALKQAEDAAAVAEAAKKELETKVAQLEADLKASGEELAALKRERRRTPPAIQSCRLVSPRRARSLAPPRTPTRILS